MNRVGFILIIVIGFILFPLTTHLFKKPIFTVIADRYGFLIPHNSTLLLNDKREDYELDYDYYKFKMERTDCDNMLRERPFQPSDLQWQVSDSHENGVRRDNSFILLSVHFDEWKINDSRVLCFTKKDIKTIDSYYVSIVVCGDVDGKNSVIVYMIFKRYSKINGRG